jgi:type I restriction enzyme S subunit
MPTHCKLKDGDILLSLTGNVGRVCLVNGSNYLLNQRVANLIPIIENNRAFTYFLFRQKDFQNTLMSISRGTAQQNLSPIETKSLEIVVPSQEALDRFSKIASPILKMLIENHNEIRNLLILRDSLLPRLLNGKIVVK